MRFSMWAAKFEKRTRRLIQKLDDKGMRRQCRNYLARLAQEARDGLKKLAVQAEDAERTLTVEKPKGNPAERSKTVSAPGEPSQQKSGEPLCL